MYLLLVSMYLLLVYRVIKCFVPESCVWVIARFGVWYGSGGGGPGGGGGVKGCAVFLQGGCVSGMIVDMECSAYLFLLCFTPQQFAGSNGNVCLFYALVDNMQEFLSLFVCGGGVWDLFATWGRGGGELPVRFVYIWLYFRSARI